MRLDAQRPGRRPDRAEVGRAASSSMKLVNPANKRNFTVVVVGLGARRRLGRGVARRARLRRRLLLLPGLAAPRALDRRAGRHQRRQELPERRRQRLPAVLRHDQGRRLPRARGQRLPPGASSRSNIIDQCVAQGVPVRARVRRPARQPLLRRRPGLAHLLRPRPDRPAAPARRLPGARAPDRGRQGARCTRAPRCSTWWSTDGRGARHRRARPGHRRDPAPRRRRGGARHRRLRQRLLPLDQRQGLQRHRDLARAPARRAVRQPLLHADPPDLHPGRRATTSRSSR